MTVRRSEGRGGGSERQDRGRRLQFAGVGRRPLGEQVRVSVGDDGLRQLDVVLAVADAADRLQTVARRRQIEAVAEQVGLSCA